MELWIGALSLGLLYAFMTMGVFITFRIHNFPDITVDGSFTSGAAIMAVLIVTGMNPFLALGAAFIIGAVAGCATALINTRLNVSGLLAGILVMTGLYSINLHIMGRSNIPLLNETTLFTYLSRLNPGLNGEIWTCIALGLVMVLFWLAVSLFFKTDLGIAMRITGNNPTMAAANGVNVGRMTIFGVALANGLVGVSGGLVAQYQGFADIGMGIGTVVIGLAAVIIGESILRAPSMYAKVLSVLIGSVIFRLMIAIALFVGMNPIDLKLLTASFVLITLIVSKTVAGREKSSDKLFRKIAGFFQVKRIAYGLTAAIIMSTIVLFGYKDFSQRPVAPQKMKKIGVVQLTDNALLNITRDSLVKEMEKIGYRDGHNCTIMLENANGDLPTVNSIIDKFLQEKADIVVSISTGCTQAAINKIKDRPVVFATVANPFIIGAGKSETDHTANVTGVFGSVPMDKTLEVVRRILPGKLIIGAIWDSAQANSVFNAENLQKAAQAYDDVTFEGTTITSSAEVYEAAVSLVQKGIGAFVLPTDNTVYSAFESVIKAARIKNIPVFTSDVERLADGALGVVGYDYTSSGIQAAHLVDRVLKGESPQNIPFERYRKLTFGINLEVAEAIGISISPELISQATIVHRGREAEKTKLSETETAGQRKAVPKKLVLFLFSENKIVLEAAQGVTEELEHSGILQRHTITIDTKNAQNEFYVAQSIAQDIVQQSYDYIITLSTPALQVMANTNKKIPHIFGAVTDPYRMGVAKSSTAHLPNITGVATFQPVETTIRVMREVFPQAKRIGIIWNPAEACSEACTYKAREAAKKYDFDLQEKNVNSTAEVLDALRSLLNRSIDLFLISGDNTVMMALESVAEILKEHKILFFTNTPSDVDHGAFISIGADYTEVGKETARMAARVIEGEDPKSIPINDYLPEKMAVNLSLAGEYGINIPETVLNRAAYVKRGR